MNHHIPKVIHRVSSLTVAISLTMVISLTGCSRDDQAKESDTVREITLMTHDSFSASARVIEAFEKKNHAKVVFLKSGDAGEALNKAILSKNNPLADIFYGVDNTFLSRALAEDLFLSYASPQLAHVKDSLKLDPENRLVPVDYGDVCINYDRNWFREKKIDPPSSLEDLLAPGYKGLTVVENPATSSPGLAFLLTTVARFGEQGYLDFWQQLQNNDVLITSGWKEAYWGKFSAASEGSRPVVVSYASSPAAEVFFSKTPMEAAPTGVVTDDGSAFRQIEFAGILKKTQNLDLAKKLMDFLLSTQFQEDIPLQMFVFPSNKEAVLPEVFTTHATITDDPAVIEYKIISEKRDLWIEQWTESML